MKLTDAHKAILRRLLRFGPESGPEISEGFRKPAYWAKGRLATMERMGFVERRGQTSSGGLCFTVTPSGTAALSDPEQP